MAHTSHYDKKKYRQWVKAGLGLRYLKDGLAPFCKNVAEKQHKDILDELKEETGNSSVNCEKKCNILKLKPNHEKIGGKCIKGVLKCNCCSPNTVPCPKQICGFIYDKIIDSHASTPPLPNWKNTEAEKWTDDHWSIAKCFIPAPGYQQTTSAYTTDCTGLLQLVENNLYFHNHVNISIRADLFSKVRQCRNEIFHSHNMELDETVANSYIDDMIAVLQDEKDLKYQKDAREAVLKLKELKKKNFIIATGNFETIVRDISQEVRDMRQNLEDVTKDVARKEDVKALKDRISELESKQEILENDDYEMNKSELKGKLLQAYKDDLFHMSVIPLQKDKNVRDLGDIYEKPRMTFESDDREGNSTNEVLSLSNMFTKMGTRPSSIYILGEVGSGKSSFCKYLAKIWCLAHSGEEINTFETNEIEELKKFEFLFIIFLCDYSDTNTIKEMLGKKYEHPVLERLLRCESEKCLIILDGLDEWKTHTIYSDFKGPPKREFMTSYTVLTTTRPWKIKKLEITNNEMKHKIFLKGFDEDSVNSLITKTIPVLNNMFKKEYNSSDCEIAMKNYSETNLSQNPLIVQHLIWLWFDNRLRNTTRCALISIVLDLLFEWSEQKDLSNLLLKEMRKKSRHRQGIDFPKYLNDNKTCKLYRYIVEGVSCLAYETLINNTPERSLLSESYIYDELEISEEIRTCCIKVGILSQDKSSNRVSCLSFVHKSMQEFLAAIYFSTHFEIHLKSLTFRKKVNMSETFVLKNFTLDELLNQENFFIMLCGLKPKIATAISERIVDIESKDKRFLKYRRSIDDKNKFTNLILRIQQFILKVVAEVLVCDSYVTPRLYLGDIIVRSQTDCDALCSAFQQQYILPEKNVSLRISILLQNEETISRILKYIKACDSFDIQFCCKENIHGESIRHACSRTYMNEETLKRLSVTFSSNVSLNYVQVNPIYKSLIRCLPKLKNLVALELEGFTATHEEFTIICTFLSNNKYLEQISVPFQCVCKRNHQINLKKSSQLRYLGFKNNIFVSSDDTSKLEILKFESLNTTDLKVFELIRTAFSLTELELSFQTSASIVYVRDIKENVSNEKTQYHSDLTQQLISVLPILHKLKKLTLCYVTLADNIIKFPQNTRNIRFINLTGVIMSLTTWIKMIDSLAEMPQSVHVRASNPGIARDGTEFNQSIDICGQGGGKEADAFCYVKEKETLFKISRDEEKLLAFSTRK